MKSQWEKYVIHISRNYIYLYLFGFLNGRNPLSLKGANMNLLVVLPTQLYTHDNWNLVEVWLWRQCPWRCPLNRPYFNFSLAKWLRFSTYLVYKFIDGTELTDCAFLRKVVACWNKINN